MFFLCSSQGRAGADGARGMPGEPGTKVPSLPLFKHHQPEASTRLRSFFIGPIRIDIKT